MLNTQKASICKMGNNPAFDTTTYIVPVGLSFMDGVLFYFGNNVALNSHHSYNVVTTYM